MPLSSQLSFKSWTMWALVATTPNPYWDMMALSTSVPSPLPKSTRELCLLWCHGQGTRPSFQTLRSLCLTPYLSNIQL